MLGVPVNVLASIAFIHRLFGAPELGVVGAAIGSAIASVLRAGFPGICLWHKTGFFRGMRGWRNGSFAASLRRYLIFALPIAATFIGATAASNACMLHYAKLDVTASAAMTLIMSCIMGAGTVGMSRAQSTGIIVAQLLDNDRRGAAFDRFRRGGVPCGLSALALAPSRIEPADAGDPHRRLAGLSAPAVPQGLERDLRQHAAHGRRDGLGDAHLRLVAMALPGAALRMILSLDAPAAWMFSLLLVEEVIKLPAFHARLVRGDWKLAQISACPCRAGYLRAAVAVRRIMQGTAAHAASTVR